ncbi:hypothetical protein [Halomonas getboli]|uniref:hypothetical protein n=1 Tax=Halomonas getboli TaxID=2935862 RepID=UPI001FFFCFEF|nr:hypothetical protein [Halomonas getboli]MCK2183064.1 hypothetical protein [Halomonas getboli]
MNQQARERSAGPDASAEGATLLALRPASWEWGMAMVPSGVVLESHEVVLTAGGWRYLRPRLLPMPPAWPEDSPDGLQLAIKCLVLAAGMPLPSRCGEDGWLLLSRPQEVTAISHLLLNPHGVHFLNHAQHERYADRWPARVEQLRGFLARHGLSPQEVLFDSSLVLELYGIRLAGDIDFLSLQEIDLEDPLFSANDEALIHHAVDKRLLIDDDRYHFVVDGLKFVSFEQLRHMKQSRQRLKDLNDLAMMTALEEGRQCRLVIGRCIWRLKWRRLFTKAREGEFQRQGTMTRKFLTVVKMTRRATSRLAHRTGAYGLLRWLMRCRRH